MHGGRDHCRNWDWVALELRRPFSSSIAPDLRGHGDSDWAIGGSYSMIDYVLDLVPADERDRRRPGHLDRPFARRGSGPAGRPACIPDAVKALVAIEGLGPPPAMLRETPAYERMENWVGDMQALAQRKPREYPTIEEALARMREANPHLSREQARHLTIHGVRRNENGTYSWKFDNYARATSPYLFNTQGRDAKSGGRFAARRCWCAATESWAGDWERDGRLRLFRTAELVTINKAGHWVHHDQLAEFLAVVRRFLGVSDRREFLGSVPDGSAKRARESALMRCRGRYRYALMSSTTRCRFCWRRRSACWPRWAIWVFAVLIEFFTWVFRGWSGARSKSNAAAGSSDWCRWFC